MFGQKTYPSLEEGREKMCCYWFVGLVIKAKPSDESGQPQNLDLTTPIRAFTELVMRTAITINVWKDGMKVEAFYKKRKQLSEYLPTSERHKLKVVKQPNVNSPARNTSVDKSNENSMNSMTEAPIAASVTPTGGKRRASDPDSEADMSGDSSRMECDGENAQPPIKKLNTTTSVSTGNTNTATSGGSVTITNGSSNGGGLEVS